MTSKQAEELERKIINCIDRIEVWVGKNVDMSDSLVRARFLIFVDTEKAAARYVVRRATCGCGGGEG